MWGWADYMRLSPKVNKWLRLGLARGAGLGQQKLVPVVAVARHLKRLQRQQASPANRLFKIGELGEGRRQIGIERYVEARLPRHQHGLGLH